jgi:hypothetical protein
VQISFFLSELIKLLFRLDDKQISKIDFSEVNYLYENIRTKSILSKQNCKCTVQSYKAVLAAYLTFGLNDTIKLIMDGNSSITLDDVKDLQNYVVNARLLDFKQNNSSIFQNMAKKIVAKLSVFDKDIDIKVFEKEIRKNTYLDNIIYLMLENNFDNYNNIVEMLFNYVKYHDGNEYQAKREIYDYSKNFIENYLANKAKEYNNEFESVILSNFKPKETVIYAKRKETIERCFADGKENFGLRFTRYTGLKRVTQGLLLLFACMNFKKMAKWKALKA